MVKLAIPLIALAFALSACSGPGSPPTGEPAFYQGTIEGICSPIDATGLELRLEKQSGSGPPLAIIRLWAPLPSADPKPVELTGADTTGSLMICQSEQDCQLLQGGSVLIESESSIGASAGLFWSSSGQVHGRFSVEPIEGDKLICG